MRAIGVSLSVAFVLALASCSIPASREDLVGRYKLQEGSLRISLVLRGDGTYVETVDLTEGQRHEAKGNWTLSNGCVALSSFVLPEVMTRYPPVLESPHHIRELSARYTCLPAEKWFRNVNLVVDPDLGFAFKRTR